jgi:hypothetical protein
LAQGDPFYGLARGELVEPIHDLIHCARASMVCETPASYWSLEDWFDEKRRALHAQEASIRSRNRFESSHRFTSATAIG